jgi:hypothetical protein
VKKIKKSSVSACDLKESFFAFYEIVQENRTIIASGKFVGFGVFIASVANA